MKTDTKRQNFNITPEQEAELEFLRSALAAPTMKDAILRAARLTAALARRLRNGGKLYVGTPPSDLVEVLIPELEDGREGDRAFLVARPHPWRRQLYVKGRNLRASTVWLDMQTNRLTVEEAAENWDLPVEAVREIVCYCERSRDLLEMEASEERRRLFAQGVRIEPASAPG
ncbi:MAG: hypothetical protein AMXMBFR33_21880 [Candidatus Xenobia bacterium]